MQGTVVMLLALSGMGCHHKTCAPTGYVETCYSSGCYSSCYSDSSCYSSCYSTGYSSCYSSCYSGAAYSPADYSCYSCYSSCYSSPRHKHGLFGHKRKHCGACAPAPMAYESSACDPCSMGSSLPVYGSYTPVYTTSQMGTSQMAPAPMSGPAPAPVPVKPADAAPTAAPEAPNPGNPAPAVTPPITPPAPVPAPPPAPAVPGIPAPSTN